MKYVKWVLARFEEPSTWAGTGVVAMALHAVIPGVLGDSLLAFGGAFAAVLAIILPEKA
jgi:hypothetical protein